jgi:hypothetical protein
MNIKLADTFFDSLKKMVSIPERVGQFFRNIKWSFQKIYRRNHASDCDLWGLDYHLAEVIYPKLKAFRNINLHGHPCDFSDEDKENGVPAGEVGGGLEKWKETIDEMLFAFEFMFVDSDDKHYKKIIKEFKNKWGDWHEEKPENKQEMKWFQCKDKENRDFISTEGEGEPVSQWDFYYDSKLHQQLAERAQKGLELFGKYFWNLWD